MSRFSETQYWPLQRLGDAMDLLYPSRVRSPVQSARADSRSGTNGLFTSTVAGIDNGRPETFDAAAAAVQGACGSRRLEAVALSSEYASLVDCLAGAVPLIVPTRRGNGALVIVGAGARRVTVLATDGRRRRLPLEHVLAELRSSTPPALAESINLLRNQLGEHTASTVEAEHLKHRPIFVGWQLSPPSSAASLTRKLVLPLAARSLTLLLVHFAQFGLWILSWLTLANALFGAGEQGPLLILWGLALVTSMLALPVETWLSQDLAIRVGIVIKKTLLSRALNMDKSTVRQLGIGALIARALDANNLDALATRGGIRVLLTLFDLCIVAVLFLSYLGAQPLFLLFLVITGLTAWHCRTCLQAERVLHQAHLEVTALHTEEMIGHRTRKIFIGRDAWHDQETERLAAYESASATADSAARRLSTAPKIWTAVGTAMVLIQIYFLSTSSFGTVALVGFVIIGAATLTNITTGMAQLIRASVSISHLDLNAPHTSPAPALDGPLSLGDVATRDGTALQVQGLQYRYPTSARALIRDVDLRIAQGEKVLLSGTSGSGKSTIGALLAGRLAATAGTIISHGVDRHVAGSRGWLAHVCYVPQSSDNHVLTDTFAFNLLLGRPWPPSASDLAQAQDLSIALGLGPLLEKMPAGMMQMVGEGGWRLSQGERSRLFVARAILQNAQVLIADELLSPLDPASGLEVLDAIERLPNQLILIAHT